MPRAPALALLLAALALPSCRRDPLAVSGTVLVVVMDGVRLEESLGDDPSSATGQDPWSFMPRVWDELVPQGVRATQAWNLAATTTTPAHVAMMSGVRQAVTNYPVDGQPGLYRPDLPVLPELLRQATGIPREQVVVMANTELVQPVVHSLWPGSGFIHSADFVWVSQQGNEDQPASDDRAVINALQEKMREVPLRFALLNLHQVDRSGHYGDDKAYLDDVRWLDSPLADLWAWILEQPEYKDDTWLMIVADHGRHTEAPDDPPWRNHGCACNGCRRVPFLLLGPGVRAGETYDEPLLLTDVAPTLAALWDLPAPWADGLVQHDLFVEDLPQTSRTGLADLALAGGHRAELHTLDDPGQRSELRLDGARVSDPDAIAVEAPSMTSLGEDRAWLCFREILLEPDELDSFWCPRCLATADDGLSWDDIGTPVSAVGPYWRAALQVTDAGELLMAYPRNLNGVASAGAEGGEGEVTIDLARFDGQGWTVSSHRDIHSFPTDASAVLQGDRLMVAVAAGASGDQARHEREVLVGQAQITPDVTTWGDLAAVDLDQPDTERDWWRVEHPALHTATDGSLLLAANGFVDGGSRAVIARSEDQGQHWQQRQVMEPERPIMPHIGPVWLGDLAVWATLDPLEDRAWICSASLDDPMECVDAQTPRILRLAVEGEHLHGLVDAGVAQWEPRSWELDELR